MGARLWIVVAAARASAASAEPAEIPQPLSVEQAMQLAERVSHPIAVARAGVEAARAGVTAARGGYWPQVLVSGSYVRTLATEFDGLFDAPEPAAIELDALPFGQAHAWRAGVDVSQRLWDGGRTRSSVALAGTQRTLAELEERQRRAQVVLDAAEAYYEAALADRAVAIGEASLALTERTLAYARVGLEQGTTPEFDVVRAEVTRDIERTTLARARGARELAFVRLRQLLGIPLARPLVLTSRLDVAAHEHGRIPSVARQIAGIVEAADRVVIAQARGALESRRAQLDQARAQRWPQLSAFTSMGVVQYPSTVLPDGEWRENWTVGVSFELPLFTGFRVTAQIRQAQAERRAAERRLIEAAELAAVDAHRVATQIAVAAAALAESQRSADLAERAYGIAEVRYEQGVSSYLELADARLALARAQLNVAIAARDLRVARVRQSLLEALPLDPAIAAGVAIGRGIPGPAATPPGTAPPGTTPIGGVQPAGVAQPGRARVGGPGAIPGAP
jgi:outer membrane protein